MAGVDPELPIVKDRFAASELTLMPVFAGWSKGKPQPDLTRHSLPVVDKSRGPRARINESECKVATVNCGVYLRNSDVEGRLTQLPLELRKRLQCKGFFNRFLFRFVVHSINFDVQNSVALPDREPDEISSLDIDGFVADTRDGCLDIGNDRGLDRRPPF